jgi:hypothetical protein
MNGADRTEMIADIIAHVLEGADPAVAEELSLDDGQEEDLEDDGQEEGASAADQEQDGVS